MVIGMDEKKSLSPKPLSRTREREGARRVSDGKGEGQPSASQHQAKKVPETGGPAGPEPTRYGDWERKGRCIDF